MISLLEWQFWQWVTTHVSMASQSKAAILVYGTADVQVYKQMHVTRRASRNIEDDLRVGLVRHKEYTARERL